MVSMLQGSYILQPRNTILTGIGPTPGLTPVSYLYFSLLVAIDLWTGTALVREKCDWSVAVYPKRSSEWFGHILYVDHEIFGTAL